MALIKTFPMQHSNILRINSERDIIDTNPEYQRQGEIWTVEKRQLLIDSILNNYDIPKLYLHQLTGKLKRDSKYEYAIIDGRQRLESIWAFIDGKISTAEDFIYFKDTSIEAGNLTYSELSKKYPRLKIHFDSFNLPIILVETNDLDLIEEMFSRLNEAVPLNASEKRNAFGGPMAKLIKNISNHSFFEDKVKFSNNRYQFREVSAKLLFVEYSLMLNEKIIDTKKAYLDSFVKDFKNNKDKKEYNEFSTKLKNKLKNILNEMLNTFSDKDILLKAQSPITIYYLLFREAIEDDYRDKINRQILAKFNDEREKNRKIAELDIVKANFDFLEYDRMSQSGTNDSVSIRERFKIIREYVNK